MGLLFLGTSLYIMLYHNTFNVKWLLIAVITLLYFYSEKIGKLLNQKVVYILLFGLSYFFSKFCDTKFFCVTINSNISLLITLFFIILFISSLFFSKNKRDL